MDSAELRKIASEGSGNSYNVWDIQSVGNLNPSARVVNTYNYVPIKPMFITKVVNMLSDPSFSAQEFSELDFKRYKIHEKENYNALRRWKYDIKLYAPYHKTMDDIYSGFGDMGQYKREEVYQWLNREYRRLHDTLCADELFDALKDFVLSKVNRDITLFDNVCYEEMEQSVCIVLVDAFIECRIFEKPI